MDERRFVALILLGLSRHFSSLFLTSAFTWSSVCAGVRGWVCTCVCVCVGERETACAVPGGLHLCAMLS